MKTIISIFIVLSVCATMSLAQSGYRPPSSGGGGGSGDIEGVTAVAPVTGGGTSGTVTVGVDTTSGSFTKLATQAMLSLKAPVASPTFTGTVTIPTPFTLGAVSVLPTGTELNFVDGVTSAIQTQLDAKAPSASPTLTGTVTVDGNILTNPKKYVALLTQSATGAPTATVLENTLGGTPTWARGAAGNYTATLSGAFTANKTTILIGGSNNFDWSVYVFGRDDVNTIHLRTALVPFPDAPGDYTDDVLNETTIEIRVYP